MQNCKLAQWLRAKHLAAQTLTGPNCSKGDLLHSCESTCHTDPWFDDLSLQGRNNATCSVPFFCTAKSCPPRNYWSNLKYHKQLISWIRLIILNEIWRECVRFGSMSFSAMGHPNEHTSCSSFAESQSSDVPSWPSKGMAGSIPRHQRPPRNLYGSSPNQYLKSLKPSAPWVVNIGVFSTLGDQKLSSGIEATIRHHHKLRTTPLQEPRTAAKYCGRLIQFRFKLLKNILRRHSRSALTKPSCQLSPKQPAWSGNTGCRCHHVNWLLGSRNELLLHHQIQQ